jgi:hypothetical protein
MLVVDPGSQLDVLESWEKRIERPLSASTPRPPARRSFFEYLADLLAADARGGSLQPRLPTSRGKRTERYGF